MKKKLQKYLSGEREGFSLIELIIVIAIMAILIGVIALAVIPYLQGASEETDRDILKQVNTAFKSAVTDSKVSGAINASSVSDLKTKYPDLFNKTNSFLDGDLETIESEFDSDACNGATISFARAAGSSGQITVSIVKNSSVVKDRDGNDFSIH